MFICGAAVEPIFLHVNASIAVKNVFKLSRGHHGHDPQPTIEPIAWS
jgi:hypothetical protein